MRHCNGVTKKKTSQRIFKMPRKILLLQESTGNQVTSVQHDQQNEALKSVYYGNSSVAESSHPLARFFFEII
jgi:hypothetical protein